jgi:hypothetical protein
MLAIALLEKTLRFTETGKSTSATSPKLTPEQMEQVWSALELLGETKQRDTALVHISVMDSGQGVVQLNVGSFDGKLLFLPDTKTNEPRLVPLRKESREVLAEYCLRANNKERR